MSDGTRQPVTARTAQVSPQTGTKGLGVGFLKGRGCSGFFLDSGQPGPIKPDLEDIE